MNEYLMARKIRILVKQVADLKERLDRVENEYATKKELKQQQQQQQQQQQSSFFFYDGDL